MPIAPAAAMSTPTTILRPILRTVITTTCPLRLPNPPPLLLSTQALSCSSSSQPKIRPFRTSTSPLLGKGKTKNLPPRPKPPPEHEIEESFLKGSGPGGQKINKTSSAVQLKHLPTGLVVKSQATRSRSQNRTIARQLLADKLDDLARGGESRSAVVGAVRRKKKASAAKKSRRKYRKLQEQQQQQGEQEEEDDEDDDDDDEEGEEEGEEKGEIEEEEIEEERGGKDTATRNTNHINNSTVGVKGKDTGAA
ncbi:RF-1 domain-containing protein [Biscogniauxia sp. FL1348]|nr:RF-1 domain-containing protein [Biscogniauxia sp. FL1348]